MNPKQKGAQFERDICRTLSLWVSNGKREDVFWRSAMSGGRASVRGAGTVRQAGDICSVAPEGHEFCDHWFIECKHVKTMDMLSWMTRDAGPLHRFWMFAVHEARTHGRDPMLIVRQNMFPVIVITKLSHLAHVIQPIATMQARRVDVSLLEEMVKKSCPY